MHFAIVSDLVPDLQLLLPWLLSTANNTLVFSRMARRQAAPKPEELIQKLDEKVAVIKEEIEGIIEELKNDVDVKSNQIEENKKSQEHGFEELQEALGKLKEEFKLDGKHFIVSSYVIIA